MRHVGVGSAVAQLWDLGFGTVAQLVERAWTFVEDQQWSLIDRLNNTASRYILLDVVQLPSPSLFGCTLRYE